MNRPAPWERALVAVELRTTRVRPRLGSAVSRSRRGPVGRVDDAAEGAWARRPENCYPLCAKSQAATTMTAMITRRVLASAKV